MIAQAHQPHILVVDDDERLRSLLRRYLTEHEFIVTTASSAPDAREKLKSLSYDLMVLDVMMPGESGFELTKALRDDNTQIPILLLTARSEASDRIEGFESGADDYLLKPFEPRELLLRTQKLIDLYNLHKKPNHIAFGDIIYDLNTKELTNGDEIIKLSSTEQKLLDILIEHKGNPVSRLELSDAMHGIGERSVDVQIVRLRSKIELDPKQPRFLQTIRHEGYILYI